MAASALLLGLFLVLQLTQKGDSSAASDEGALINKLLTNYEANALPVKKRTGPVKVTLDVALQSIIGLDERAQQLDTKVWYRMKWIDENLRWNSSEENAIESVTILPIQIWRPDLAIYEDLDSNPNDFLAKVYPAIVESDGTVSWNLPEIISTSCTVAVRYYPWDEQNCEFKFTSWAYNGNKLDLRNVSTKGDMAFYSSSSEWHVMSFNVERHVAIYKNVPFPDVTFTLRIRRKPMYYIFNLILPAIFIMFTAVLDFSLPPDSGEKVGLGVTVLLALTVFLLLVADSVPKADDVPLIGEYFGIAIILMAISTALTVLILNLHHRGLYGNKVPKWVRLVVLNWMARLLCMKEKVDANFTEDNSDGPENGNVNEGFNHEMSSKNSANGKPQSGDPTLFAILDVLKSFQKEKKEQDSGEACKTNWTLVAAVLDRFFLYVFLFISIVVTSVILTNHPGYSEEPIA